MLFSSLLVLLLSDRILKEIGLTGKLAGKQKNRVKAVKVARDFV